MTTESELQTQVADYLRLQYPDVLFHSDFGSGAKLTIGQAVRQKRQNGGNRAWPDMFIAEPHLVRLRKGERHAIRKAIDKRLWRVYSDGSDARPKGLFIELKKEDAKLYPGPRSRNRFESKDGKEYRTKHLQAQADVLHELRQRGYAAEFAVGFDASKSIINRYFGKKGDR